MHPCIDFNERSKILKEYVIPLEDRIKSTVLNFRLTLTSSLRTELRVLNLNFSNRQS